MKKLFIIFLALFSVFAIEAQDKPLVSVLPFNTANGGGISDADAASLTSFFEVVLINTGRYKVVEQTQADSILKTQAISLSGCADESCAIEIGKLLTADTIVLGGVNKIGGIYLLTVKMVSVELGESVKADNIRGNSLEELVDMVPDLVYRLAGLATAGNDKDKIEKPDASADDKMALPEDFVFVEGGTFQMGDEKGDLWEGCRPVHSVTVSDFAISKYEVTQKLYLEVMGTNPSYLKSNDLPVVNVSWYDAVMFCNKLSEREGLTHAYTISGTNVTWNKNANGYRLPTEAEWEYAGRAGKEELIYWKEADDACNYSNVHDITSQNVNNLSWESHNCDDGYSATSPVGSYKSNGFGLYDMLGNTWEWCKDIYSETAYTQHQKNNPLYTIGSSDHVIRGGSWFNSPDCVRNTERRGKNANWSNNNTSFRLVREAE